MSRSARIRRLFAGEDRDFALGIGEAEELQETFDCGLLPLAARVGQVDVRAIRHVLRLGLIGGGMNGPGEPGRAARLVQRELQPGRLSELAQIALDVVEAAMRGAPDERLGEPVGTATAETPSPTASSATPSSTASAPS